MGRELRNTYVLFLSELGKFTDIVTIPIKKRHPIDVIYWRDEFAIPTARYFIDRLNYKIYKRAYRFNKKKLSVITSYEKGIKTDRPHFHIAIERPESVLEANFHNYIHNIASKMHWAYGDIDIRRYRNQEFIRYMCKGNFERVLLEVCSKG